MPLNGHHNRRKPPPLHGFDDPRRGNGHDLKSLPYGVGVHRLMMGAVDFANASKCRLKGTLALNPNRMARIDTSCGRVEFAITQNRGNVLNELAAQGHIENLDSAAHPEHGLLRRHEVPDELQLQLVAIVVNTGRLGDRRLAVPARIHIATPRQEKSGIGVEIGGQAGRRSGLLGSNTPPLHPRDIPVDRIRARSCCQQPFHR